MQVKIKPSHRASIPDTVWVEPIGWQPDVSIFPHAEWIDGGAWDDRAEFAGLAITFADLGTNSPEFGSEYTVDLADIFWLASGSLKGLGSVEINRSER